MPDVSGPGGSTPAGRPRLPPAAGLDGLKYRTAAEAALEPESPAAHRVGWGFISLYTLAFISTSLLFIAPLLVTLGNEALAVAAGLLHAELPRALSPDVTYGQRFSGRVGSGCIEVLPLVHPGQRAGVWRAAHERWRHSIADQS